MAQTWHDVLFAHWAIGADVLRPLIPAELELDTYAGRCYLGVVPFRMSGVRARYLPAVPGTSAFPEMNVRTYVTLDGKPGVWFFTLEATNRLAIWTARRFFHLPYHRARMSLRHEADTVHYESVRDGVLFRGSYAPTGPVARATPGSLEHWLTERYCLYAHSPRGRLYRGEIAHAPWPLQPCTATIDACAVAQPPLPQGPPLLQFARRLDVRLWTLERLTS